MWPSWDDVEVRLDESLDGARRRRQGRRRGQRGRRRERRLVRPGRRRCSSAAANRSRAKSCARCSARKAATPKCAASSSTSATCARARICSSELTDRRRTGIGVARRDARRNCTKRSATSRCPKKSNASANVCAISKASKKYQPPDILEDVLRDYQRRGLDFLSYLVVVPFRRHSRRRHGRRQEPGHAHACRHADGVRRFGDLQVGDDVMRRDGLPHKVIGVYPQGTLPGYRITFSDGASTLCSDDHLWAVNSAVRKKRGLPYRVLTTREIRERLHDAAGNARHYIPIADPMHFGQAPDAAARPISAWDVSSATAAMTQRTAYIHDGRCGDYWKSASALLPTGTDLVYRSALRLPNPSDAATAPNRCSIGAGSTLGSSGSGLTMKFVPSIYKTAPLSDRLVDAPGLLDTDGTVNPKNDNVEFTSTSDQLGAGRRVSRSIAGRRGALSL